MGRTCSRAGPERRWIGSGTTGGALGFVDYGHPVFEVFAAPRSGDLTGARMFRYRQCAPSQSATVIARFDDGTAALVERRVDSGIVLTWTSSLDSYWNDLALRPVFVPFVHQAMKHLGRYAEKRDWRTVGEIFDAADQSMIRDSGFGIRDSGSSAVAPQRPTVLTPSGKSVEFADEARNTFTLEVRRVLRGADGRREGG